MCVYKAYGHVLCFIYIEDILEAHTPNYSYDDLYGGVGKDDSKYKWENTFTLKFLLI